MLKNEVYISVDIETTGPIPARYSMYEIGAAVVDKKGENFFREILLLNDNYVPEALSSCGRTLEGLKCREHAVSPELVMNEFAEWIKLVVPADKRPVFVAFNATFDWSFVNWYFHTYVSANPFGISGLDMKAYYMGMAHTSWADTSKNRLPAHFRSHHPHTHRAVDDAIEQADIFAKFLAHRQSRK